MINHPRTMSLLSSFSTRDTRSAISRRRMKTICSPHAHPGDGLLDIVFVSAGDQDKLGMCLSDCMDGRLAHLLSLSAKVSNCRSSGWVYHIDDEVWPDKAGFSPLTKLD